MRTLQLVAALLAVVIEISLAQTSTLQPRSPEEIQAAEDVWNAARDGFLAAYMPAPGEGVRRIPAPTMERFALDLWLDGRWRMELPHCDATIIELPFVERNVRRMGRGSPLGDHEATLSPLDVACFLGVRPYQVGGPRELLTTGMKGDWAVEKDATLPERLAGLARIVSQDVGGEWQFVEVVETRPTIIIRGKPRHVGPDKPHEFGMDQLNFLVQMMHVELRLADFVEQIEDATVWPVVLEVERGVAETTSIRFEAKSMRGSTPPSPARFEDVSEFMAAFAKATGLEWDVEDRPVTTYTLTKR